MTNDVFVMTEYSNRLNHIRNSMKNVRLPLIIKLNKKAKDLLIDLKKEYDLNDNAEAISIFK